MGCMVRSPTPPRLCPLLLQVFSGHAHSYERSLPLFNYTVDPCGTTYFVVGASPEAAPGGCSSASVEGRQAGRHAVRSLRSFTTSICHPHV